MINIESKLKRLLAEKGITMRHLANQIDVTEQGLAKMLKNNTMKVETLAKISDVVQVDPVFWFSDEPPVSYQTATGIGNAVGDSNKSKVHIGSKKMSGRQEVYGMGIDEIYIKLLTCEKDREILKTKVTGLEGMLAAKDETIRALMGSHR